jgi:hypothetical protein
MDIAKYVNGVIKIIQVQFNSIQLKLIYLLKPQPFGQRKEEQETTKIHIKYTKKN